MLQKIIEQFDDLEFLKADGFDDAIIGVDSDSKRLIYSQKKIIDILVSDDMTFDDALEYYYYNIEGSYMGDKTPIFCMDIF
jgi:hypothetical protein